jgi:hypothetical protein
MYVKISGGYNKFICVPMLVHCIIKRCGFALYIRHPLCVGLKDVFEAEGYQFYKVCVPMLVHRVGL